MATVRNTLETQFTSRGAGRVVKDTDSIGKAQTRLGQASASAGRGFAVVADEVRALAARTQNSTTEISDMLSQLLDGTESVVRAMEATKE